MVLLWLLVWLSYLAGSVPSSLLIGKLTLNVDVRQFGSGSTGATNSFRVLGWRSALIILALDIFKGWFAAAVISGWEQDGDCNMTAVLCAFAAVMGHTFPIFAGFRGGKGVATLAGALLYLFPIAVALGAPILSTVVFLTGYVGLGSLVTVSLLPLGSYFKFGTVNSWFGYFSILMALLIAFTHRGNLSRMLTGTENRFDKVRLFRTVR